MEGKISAPFLTRPSAMLLLLATRPTAVELCWLAPIDARRCAETTAGWSSGPLHLASKVLIAGTTPSTRDS
ncbi:hypothetical protein ASPCADRAFT_207804 [Aspergillus carbonarius ITEM 5010]|uniref:Secreted protein n=1 Tax=Aspergillus carbonarius (strain ITEM 5010) TaxID=602072 RepID=A0A1R3RLH4_ASPC5|nr:hypothetical protein ASPCADRAFT_207804 [Aspergillus carbonarius ITEM 5010]